MTSWVLRVHFKTILILVFSLIFFQSFFLFSERAPPIGRDFYIVTIPKAGTHLLMKLLVMLTNKSFVFDQWEPLGGFRFEGDAQGYYIVDELAIEASQRWQSENQFPVLHFNMAPVYKRFSLSHPEYIKIIQLRDLRDVCVSCAFFQSAEIEKEIGPSTFDKKLLYIINLDSHSRPVNGIFNIYRNAKEAIQWVNDPSVVISRFENLVGPKGGGTKRAQKQQISLIALKLRIHLNARKLKVVMEDLFGNKKGPQLPTTFRQGQIGGWRDYFKPMHEVAFKKNLGKLQKKLGYSLD